MGATSDHHHSVEMFGRTAVEFRITQGLAEQSFKGIKQPSILEQSTELVSIHRELAGRVKILAIGCFREALPIGDIGIAKATFEAFRRIQQCHQTIAFFREALWTEFVENPAIKIPATQVDSGFTEHFGLT